MSLLAPLALAPACCWRSPIILLYMLRLRRRESDREQHVPVIATPSGQSQHSVAEARRNTAGLS
ncbi:MAG: hypothetical protein IPK52_22455 [Chloroflexi bacterium]|nr:hypothetical protein [Chloroflexota bacterium]